MRKKTENFGNELKNYFFQNILAICLCMYFILDLFFFIYIVVMHILIFFFFFNNIRTMNRICQLILIYIQKMNEQLLKDNVVIESSKLYIYVISMFEWQSIYKGNQVVYLIFYV